MTSFIGKLGERFTLSWVESIDTSQACDLESAFVRSFTIAYRPAPDFLHLSDIELEEFLSSHFKKNVLPRLHGRAPQLFLLAQVQERLAGFSLFEKLSKREIYVSELAIDPDFWRQGLGKEMMRILHDIEPEMRRIVLLTRRINKHAQGFYESLGFKSSDYMHPGYSPETYCAYELTFDGPFAASRGCG